MEDIRDAAFESQIVVVDDKTFVNCNFLNCELHYGGGPCVFLETSIIGCRWSFGGSARRTLALIQTLEIEVSQTDFRENADMSYFSGPIQVIDVLGYSFKNFINADSVVSKPVRVQAHRAGLLLQQDPSLVVQAFPTT